ncbi:MAG: GH3 auxin-responsive promoter family protein [Elusimicrobiota bacterium]
MNSFRNYVFGEWVSDEINDLNTVKLILSKAREIKRIIYEVDREYIIETLDKIGEVFKNKNSLYYKQAYEDLKNNFKFSVPMMEETLALVPEILNKKELNKRLALELFFPYSLDNIMDRHGYDGYIRAYPKGIVLHIGAGNVFIGILDSLVMGLVTKNVNIVKISTSGSNFMNIFAQAAKDIDRRGILSRSFAILKWKGGSKTIEEELTRNVDLIMVWGGYDAVDSYRKMAPINVEVEGFGPKTSFGIVFSDFIEQQGYEDIARKVVRDCAMWDQSACSNMHDLYIVCPEGKPDKIVANLLEHLSNEFKKFGKLFPYGKISDDEKVEITKAREIARVDEAMGFSMLKSSFPDPSYTVIYEKDTSYKISPLNRVLYVKCVSDISEIKKEVLKYKDYIQSIGIGGNIFQRKKILNEFYGIAGMRFSKLGKMTIGKTGSPHDGKFVLSRLVNWVCLEGKNDPIDKLVELVKFARTNSSFYKNYYKNIKKEILSIKDFEKIPLLEKEHILKNTPPESSALFTSKPLKGIYFASGGSTGQPKYVFYDQHEYEHTIRMLAFAYEAAGLSEKDIIANLFVAGNLWSSWLSVEKAISYTKATSVPIGSNLPLENIVSYLKQFNVTTIIGLPSFLVKLAEYVHLNKIKLSIDKIFYGGEYVGDEMVNYFKEVFNGAQVKSAGYATADAGVIGFQCEHLAKGVHHLFAQSQYIEFLQPNTLKPVKPGEIGELVVSCLNKKKMPIIRYRVGDIGRFILNECSCGRKEPLFEILGRCDDRIHAGGAHIFVSDIQNAIGKIKSLSFNFQVVIYKKGVRDFIDIIVEHKRGEETKGVEKKLYEEILKNCEDLKESIKMKWIDPPNIKIVPPDTIERIQRTGKIKKVVDKRIKVKI